MKLDFRAKTFQPTANLAFEAARERERIDLFIQKVCPQIQTLKAVTHTLT
jgi:hypothetical protein